VPWVYALGFVVLTMALLWIWQNPNPAPRTVRPERVDTLSQQIQTLNERVTSLNEQVARLAQRPVTAPVDLAPLEQRVAALEKRPVTTQVDLALLEQRVAALEKRPVATPDLAPIEQQIGALKSQIAAKTAVAPAGDLGPVESRVAALAQQVQAVPALKSQLDTMSRQIASQQAGVGSRLSQLETDRRGLNVRVGDLEDALKSAMVTLTGQIQSARQQASVAASAAEKAARLARIEAARAALESGRPVGSIEGAPPALTQFAGTSPPTEAGLRLAFPAAAKAALDAAQPDTAGKPFGERLWQRAQQLVTVREGDRVIVGDPAAGVLAHAQQELGAGDLSGAVASVSTLTGPAAQAMASWLDRAKALLAARAALDSMAAHA
jgi:hypothetical protein